MSASNQIFLVVDAGTPVAAFTVRQELKAYLRRRLDVFINPLLAHKGDKYENPNDREHQYNEREHSWRIHCASPLRCYERSRCYDAARLIYRCCGLTSAISKEGYEQRLIYRRGAS